MNKEYERILEIYDATLPDSLPIELYNQEEREIFEMAKKETEEFYNENGFYPSYCVPYDMEDFCDDETNNN